MEAGKPVPKQAVEVTEGNRQNLTNARHKVSLCQPTAGPEAPPLCRPAIITLGLMMPVQEGCNTLRQLKERPPSPPWRGIFG